MIPIKKHYTQEALRRLEEAIPVNRSFDILMKVTFSLDEWEQLVSLVKEKITESEDK